jgi:hypothetical protein
VYEPPNEEDESMSRYLLIQNYEGGVCDQPMGTWEPADVKAHIDFQLTLNAELTASGELVDAQGVAAEAQRVTSDGAGVPMQLPIEVREVMVAP